MNVNEARRTDREDPLKKVVIEGDRSGRKEEEKE